MGLEKNYSCNEIFGAWGYCPTLAGLGNDKTNLTSHIGLDTHIENVCKVIDQTDEKIILLGHSYGGIVVSGVAKKRPEKIDMLIYLDAPIPENNQSLLDILGEEAATLFTTSKEEPGKGWRVDPFPAESFGLSKSHDWAIKEHSGQSLKCFTDKVTILQSGEAPNLHVIYIHCLPGNDFTKKQVELATTKGWKCYSIEASHCPMITNPDKLVELFKKIVQDFEMYSNSTFNRL